MNIITIGIYLTEDKKEGISWPKFIKLCEDYNNRNIIHGNQIELVDITENNYKTVKFKFILAKFDEFYMNNTVNENLLTWMSTQNNLIDPLNSQMNLGNRLIMADKLTEICTNFEKLFVPEYIYMTKLNYCPELKFPIICKPNIAFGSSIAHSMCIVNNFESLTTAKIYLPVFLQTFYEHGSIIFKVYVVKDNISVCIKNSISFCDSVVNNFEKNDDNQEEQKKLTDNSQNKEIIYFDTSDLKKVCLNISKGEIDDLLELLKEEVDLNSLSKIISKTFGVSLFGYDLIKVGNMYAIIDVNYFPGYNGSPEFHTNLLNYFIG
mgnify:CR=1 FL=1